MSRHHRKRHFTRFEEDFLTEVLEIGIATLRPTYPKIESDAAALRQIGKQIHTRALANRWRIKVTPIFSRYWTEEIFSCWIWRGTKSGGYGMIRDEYTQTQAYRVAYRLFIGNIPPEKVLDHLCRNPSCVNPLHLEPVPPQINVLRGISPAAQHARQTHCKRGHEFT